MPHGLQRCQFHQQPISSSMNQRAKLSAWRITIRRFTDFWDLIQNLSRASLVNPCRSLKSILPTRLYSERCVCLESADESLDPALHQPTLTARFLILKGGRDA